MTRNRLASLTALGVDNFGSGLFLPVALLYVTRIVRLPLATAGTIIALETMAGLARAPLAGRPVGPAGPPAVVVPAAVLPGARGGGLLGAPRAARGGAGGRVPSRGPAEVFCSV